MALAGRANVVRPGQTAELVVALYMQAYLVSAEHAAPAACSSGSVDPDKAAQYALVTFVPPPIVAPVDLVGE